MGIPDVKYNESPRAYYKRLHQWLAGRRSIAHADLFSNLTKSSVNLETKNTKNRADRDLSNLQLYHLAESVYGRETKS